jgi:hypothetical protein
MSERRPIHNNEPYHDLITSFRTVCDQAIEGDVSSFGAFFAFDGDPYSDRYKNCKITREYSTELGSGYNFEAKTRVATLPNGTWFYCVDIAAWDNGEVEKRIELNFEENEGTEIAQSRDKSINEEMGVEPSHASINIWADYCEAKELEEQTGVHRASLNELITCIKKIQNQIDNAHLHPGNYDTTIKPWGEVCDIPSGYFGIINKAAESIKDLARKAAWGDKYAWGLDGKSNLVATAPLEQKEQTSNTVTAGNLSLHYDSTEIFRGITLDLTPSGNHKYYIDTNNMLWIIREDARHKVGRLRAALLYRQAKNLVIGS